jgi:hypothetical protein
MPIKIFDLIIWDAFQKKLFNYMEKTDFCTEKVII